jgi:hypothetical protein
MRGGSGWKGGLRAAFGLAVLSGLAAVVTARPALATVATISEASCDASVGASLVSQTGCTDTTYSPSFGAGLNTRFVAGAFPTSNPSADSFATAFAAWDSKYSATYGNWKVVDGGTLNLDLTVASFAGSIGQYTGGLSSIQVDVSNYKPTTGQPSLGQLVWTQALFISYTPTLGGLTTPIETLDTYSLSQGSSGSGGAFQAACETLPAGNPATIGQVGSGKAYCDPIYPFQYSNKMFYDAPQGAWANDSFRAVTLLSSVDTEDDTLTVYQGFTYGFTLATAQNTVTTWPQLSGTVAEPGTGWLLGALLLPLGLVRRNRRVPGAV